jgi:hypothetical protein
MPTHVTCLNGPRHKLCALSHLARTKFVFPPCSRYSFALLLSTIVIFLRKVTGMRAPAGTRVRVWKGTGTRVRSLVCFAIPVHIWTGIDTST